MLIIMPWTDLIKHLVPCLNIRLFQDFLIKWENMASYFCSIQCDYASVMCSLDFIHLNVRNWNAWNHRFPIWNSAACLSWLTSKGKKKKPDSRNWTSTEAAKQATLDRVLLPRLGGLLQHRTHRLCLSCGGGSPCVCVCVYFMGRGGMFSLSETISLYSNVLSKFICSLRQGNRHTEIRLSPAGSVKHPSRVSLSPTPSPLNILPKD